MTKDVRRLDNLEVLIEESLDIIGSVAVLTGLLIGLSRAERTGLSRDHMERPSV